MGLFWWFCAPKTPQASFNCSSIFLTKEWSSLSMFATILWQNLLWFGVCCGEVLGVVRGVICEDVFGSGAPYRKVYMIYRY